GLVDAQIPESRIEPDAVLDDWPAHARTEIVVLRQHADVGEEIARLVEGRVAGQIRLGTGLPDARRAAIVRAPGLRRVVAEDDAAEPVAAVSRHHVDADAALTHFGGVGARHVADFLQALIVPVHAAVGAVGTQVVQPNSLDGLHGVGRPPILQRRLLQAARAADIARQRAAAANREVRTGNQDAD